MFNDKRQMRLAWGVLIAFASAIALSASAQSGGDFEIVASTVDGGGTATSGGLFDVHGTVGQPEAGSRSQGGAFDLQGGFWTDEQADYLFADSFGPNATP